MLINSCPDLNSDYQKAHTDCGFECEECFPPEEDCPDCGEWNRCTCFDDDTDQDDDFDLTDDLYDQL